MSFRQRHGRLRGRQLGREELSDSLRTGFVQLVHRFQALEVVGSLYLACGEICRTLRRPPPSPVDPVHELQALVADCQWDEFYEICELMFKATRYYHVAEERGHTRAGRPTQAYTRMLKEIKDGEDRSQARIAARLLEQASTYQDELNRLLGEEGAPWRMKNGHVVPAFPEEVEAVLDDATAAAEGLDRPGTADHLDRARRLLGLRPEPELRNAVKEAVSAVEAAVKDKSGSDKIEKGLQILKQQRRLTPHWSSAIQTLWQYSSRAPQVRHGSPDLSKLTYEEARDLVALAAVLVQHVAGLPKARR